MPEFIEIPASKKSLVNRKPVYGVGINDADYVTRPKINGDQVVCPYYRTWSSMIVRSYSDKYQVSRPTYIGCSVTKEWLIFSNFRKWMETQDWQGKQLDKDILIPGNKVYRPDTCVFVSRQINTLLTDSAAARGEYPQGVDFHKATGKYRASCKVIGNQKYLGLFTAIPEAEYEYLTFKSKLIKSIAYEDESISNPELQEALLRHYKLFKDKAGKIITKS